MKAKIKKTGEIVDGFKDIDFKTGKLVQFVTNYGQTFLPKDIDYIVIDWSQRRYEIAKATMQGILSNQAQVKNAVWIAGGNTSSSSIAQYAVACADALIAELKKE